MARKQSLLQHGGSFALRFLKTECQKTELQDSPLRHTNLVLGSSGSCMEATGAMRLLLLQGGLHQLANTPAKAQASLGTAEHDLGVC